MGLFKENLQSKETTINSNMVQQDQQFAKVDQMNAKATMESQKEKVLNAKGLEEVKADQFEDMTESGHMVVQSNMDTDSSDRAIRERADQKTDSAMKLKKMLQDLGYSGNSFDELIKSNETIQAIESLNEDKSALSKEAVRKIGILDGHAPQVYERLLKLEHILKLMEGRSEKYPDLYDFVMKEKNQAEHEWEHVSQMAGKVELKTDADSAEGPA